MSDYQRHPLIANVPCNGCVACCHHTLIVLMPEHGDLADLYETQDVLSPLTGLPAKALKQTQDGACIYVRSHGCSIHDHRPAICKSFDCRRYFLDFATREERRRAIRNGMADPAVIRAGAARLASLKKGEVA
jgi:Fe-S-cluster containining protein